jgi:hypothetical protein
LLQQLSVIGLVHSRLACSGTLVDGGDRRLGLRATAGAQGAGYRSSQLEERVAKINVYGAVQLFQLGYRHVGKLR